MSVLLFNAGKNDTEGKWHEFKKKKRKDLFLVHFFTHRANCTLREEFEWKIETETIKCNILSLYAKKGVSTQRHILVVLCTFLHSIVCNSFLWWLCVSSSFPSVHLSLAVLFALVVVHTSVCANYKRRTMHCLHMVVVDGDDVVVFIFLQFFCRIERNVCYETIKCILTHALTHIRARIHSDGGGASCALKNYFFSWATMAIRIYVLSLFVPLSLSPSRFCLQFTVYLSQCLFFRFSRRRRRYIHFGFRSNNAFA